MSYIEENEELYRAWIGQKKQDKYFEKIKKSGFSFTGLIVPHLLLITRKMYIETVILVIIQIILDLFTELLGIKEETTVIINFATNLTIAFSYYSLYEWNIRRKIEKYREQGISDEEQIKIAQKYGGDKITLKVVIAILVLIISSMFFITAKEIILANISQKKDDTTNNKAVSSKTNNFLEENTEISKQKNNPFEELTSTWFVEDCTLKYDLEYWEESIENGHQVLKYKNNELYLYYAGNAEIENGKKMCEKEEFRSYLENDIKSNLAKNEPPLIIQNTGWDKINNDFYLLKVETITENNEQSQEYLDIYYCITDNNIYTFMVDVGSSIVEYKNEVEKVIYTIEK